MWCAINCCQPQRLLLLLYFFTDLKYISSLKGKLIGEKPVEQENYKFTASFRRENVQFCAASLLSNKHALTAASCLKDFLIEIDIPDFDLYTLVAGKRDVNKGSAVFEIEEVQVHRDFRFESPNCNYALGLITV